jgi:DNA gyrase subunit A
MADDPIQPALPDDDELGISEVTIEEEVRYSFLEYAMSVIVSRALPDVRDGLKPVHRRILYAALEAGLRPDQRYRKSAALVGDVMKKYHPHGDQAIYDAMVRLAQDFSTRYLLISGQGNFGSVDGDAPAAMRYCVTGDTLIRTADGTVRIDEIADLEADSEQDIELKVQGRRGEPVLADKIFHSGSHPTLRIRTAEGYELSGTRNHPVLCLENVAGVPMLLWRLLEEVRPGTLLALRSDAEPEGRLGPAAELVEEYRRTASPREAGLVAQPLLDEGYVFDVAREVTDAGVQPVYSLRVDTDEHAFVTNGFISHNTESRLSPLAMELVRDINEETVDFTPNYDNEELEPSVLPARFPNLLVNGSSGIAVGMATNIPPHNLGEVVDAVVEYLRRPELANDREELLKVVMKHIKGPDFPTGGLILGRQGIIDAYTTGRGSVKMRAVAEIEEGPKGAPRIVITELPYQVNKARLAAKIAELVNAKTNRLEGIADLRDESSERGGLRLVIELKRNAVPQVVLNSLYKRTQLQDNFNVNMLALVDGIPRTLNIAEVIEEYAAHQVTVITRRTRYRLRKAEERSHILEGLIIALDHIDEIVALIRAAANVEEARNGLIARFGLSEVQAQHILDMPLRRLTALEQDKIREEYETLQRTIADLRAILADPSRVRAIIAEELTVIRDKYADERRSRLVHDEGEFDIEDLIADEDLVVSVSRDGYVKSVPLDTYRRQGRGGRGVKGAGLKEGDIVEHLITTTAHSYLLLFSSNGRVYRIKAHEIPKRDRTARGTAVVNVVPMRPEDKVAAVIDTRDYETYRYLLIATKKGIVKKTVFREYDSSRREGIIAVNLREGDEVVKVRPTSGNDDILLLSSKGKAIRFREELVRPMGRTATGVIGIKLDEDDQVVTGDVITDENDELLVVTEFGYGKRTKLAQFPRKGRSGKGVIAAKLTRPRGPIVGASVVRSGDEVFLISDDGVVIRMSVDSISRQGRPATGVRVMNLAKDARVSAVAPVVGESEEADQGKAARQVGGGRLAGLR